jgi:hypothetical protein
MEITRAILVLADISGYTKFITLHTMSLLHAEKIVTELMEAIIERVELPMRLNKLEGDALLLFAEAGESETETAREVLNQTLVFFEAFRAKSKELTGCNNLCPCDACREAEQLRLKTIVHAGEIAVKRVKNFEELAGPSVILAHRLLKNSIKSKEYILLTKDYLSLAEAVDAVPLKTESRHERYDDLGKVEFRVHFPEPEEGEQLDAKGSVRKRLSNAWSLDLYGVGRSLGLVSKPERLGSEDEPPSFGGFSRDGFEGLGMLFRKKK